MVLGRVMRLFVMMVPVGMMVMPRLVEWSVPQKELVLRVRDATEPTARLECIMEGQESRKI